MQTVFLTGASGYIAKYILRDLLNAGYAVRGSIRSLNRAEEVRAAVRPHLNDPDAADSRLDLVALDLSKDAGWDTALTGCDALMHTASPFPLEQPKDETVVIRPAVDGTLRALRAAQAAGINRVILTSSTVAISGSPLPPGDSAYDERHWTDIETPGTSPYAKSKTLAEQAAWAFVKDTDIALTTVNPGFVLGAPLDANFGTSIAVVERLLRGKDPMLPDISFLSVDIEDIAALHLAALQNEATAGQRIMGAGRTLAFRDLAMALKSDHPDRRIATRIAPKWLLRLLALFDPAIRGILPQIGVHQTSNPARAEALLGRPLKDPLAALRRAGQYLVSNTLV